MTAGNGGAADCGSGGTSTRTGGSGGGIRVYLNNTQGNSNDVTWTLITGNGVAGAGSPLRHCADGDVSQPVAGVGGGLSLPPQAKNARISASKAAGASSGT